MKRITYLLSLLLLIALSFSSCKLFNPGSGSEKPGNEGENENQDGNGTDEVIDSTVWSSGFDTAIVTEEITQEVLNLQQHIYTLTGKTPAIVKPGEGSAVHEIVIGETDRVVSQNGYSKLDRYADRFQYVQIFQVALHCRGSDHDRLPLLLYRRASLRAFHQRHPPSGTGVFRAPAGEPCQAVQRAGSDLPRCCHRRDGLFLPRL